jgi:hypothetical protein
MSKARDLANQVSNLIQISTGGSNFEQDIIYNSASPVSASVGTLWVDSSGANPMMKVWDGSSWDSLGSAPVPIITGIAPDNVSGSASTAIIINGQNFESGSIVKLIDSLGTELFVLSSTFNNARSLQFLTPALTASAGPYDVKVTNPDNQISILENCLTVGTTPTWVTNSGSLGLIYDSMRSSKTFTVQATDADNHAITYSIVSGSLPTNMTMTNQGVISGTAQAVASDTTYAFTIRATDTIGAFNERSFSITTKAPVVQSFTSVGSTSWGSLVTGNIRVLVVAGGGAGGYDCGGGGGGGGVVSNLSFAVTEGTNYVLTVGNGGAAVSGAVGSSGGNSTFSSITATGGGRGGGSANNGAIGGSGGGGAGNPISTGGNGTSLQGNSGATGIQYTVSSNQFYLGGGGGGAGGAGSQGTSGNNTGGNGGVGILNDITGSNVYYGGGGGGGTVSGNYNVATYGGSGGLGGGGNAGFGGQNSNGSLTTPGTSGTNGLGGGGGAGGYTQLSGSGGSGIVILRY